MLQNENNKINLGIVKFKSGKSNDIFEALQKLLNDFDAGSHFKTCFESYCKL